jgi:two-component system LytT family response regulator
MGKRIKVIIVDDELEAREGLKLLLGKDQEVDIVSICKNGIEAIEALTNFSVDLMFLDIQMPMVDGFEVIRSVPENRLPSIIFTTAYDQFALRAFEVHAIDYLLKPFTDDKFFKSLNRAKEIISQKDQGKYISTMKEIAQEAVSTGDEHVMLYSNQPSLNRLIIKESGRVHFLELPKIIWIEAFDYYVKIHVEGRFYLLRESMKKLMEGLPAEMFIRIHKSSIININYLKFIEIIGNGEYMAHMNSGNELKVSRSFKDSVKHLL